MSVNSAFIHELITRFGNDQVLTDPASCLLYGYDNSRRQGNPDAVLIATETTQIQHAVTLCYQHAIPVIARGRGTGTPGGTVPLTGGLVISCERLDNILQIDPANRMMIVEPGVTNQAIQKAAAAHGFFWPPDPSSAAYCTVGGNLAYNSAGPRAVKYGTTRENTLGLQVVIGTGEVIHTGTKTTKGVVGYDLTRLLIGSEGTLGIITQATLKLTPLAPIKQTLRAAFSDIYSASQAVTSIMAQAVVPCALEFIDAKAIELLRTYDPRLHLPDKAHALLIIEIDGMSEAMPAAIQQIKKAVQNNGLLEIHTAATAGQSEQLWAARKALSPALRTLAPNKINEDVVVPVSALPDLISGLEKLSQQHGITIVNFGHAGNGNIHVNLLTDSLDEKLKQQAQRCLSDVFDLVLRLQGTLSGEHGVAIEKRDFIDREIDPTSLQLMRAIKTVFDPKGILNPGKIFPLQS